MTDDEKIFNRHVSRRGFLAAAGVTLAAGPLAGTAVAEPAVELTTTTGDPAKSPAVAGLHLQFGADAADEVVVSWHALQPTRNARVLLGRADGRYERSVPAKTVSYTDAKSGQVV
ncbi:twin-arginine translocation signal domain-containing protein, partial [Amycolatopsis mediterranei]|uniref:twin-arginine translocation signal domain-containing protein n=1 Tax=Amycolatopsis mediterranei TaxID=33910 RepID=UPI003320F721